MRTNRRITASGDSQARTRAEIIAVFRQLVKQHGFPKVTMEDIAAGLGKKKSFLYYYFQNKRDVLHAMVQDELCTLQQMARDAAEHGSAAPERVRNYFRARVEGVIKRVESYASARPVELCSESAHPNVGDLIQMRQEFDRDEERFLATLLRQGMKEGSFRTIGSKTISDLTYFMLSAVRGVELELILTRGGRAHRGHHMGAVLDVFLRGLAP